LPRKEKKKEKKLKGKGRGKGGEEEKKEVFCFFKWQDSELRPWTSPVEREQTKGEGGEKKKKKGDFAKLRFISVGSLPVNQVGREGKTGGEGGKKKLPMSW